ncbi:MAG: TolC family protein [Flavisolibacter sp.]
MKKTNLALILFLLAAEVTYGQQKYELTVREAVELAYKNVVELKNAHLDYKIQEAKNKEITGQALPQVSGNVAGSKYLQIPTILFPQSDQGIYDVLIREGLLPTGSKAPPPNYQQLSFQQPWNLNAGATLTQLLFQPDVFVGLQARQSALDYSTALIEQTKEKIKDSAYRRYYAILVTERQLYFINENLSRLQKLYHDDSIMYVNGFAEQLDLDKVQVQINNMKNMQSTVQTSLSIAHASLKFALGISQKDTVVLKEELSVATIKEGILDESFIYDNRAEIKTLNSLQKLQKLDIKRYKLGYLPTVALSGNYSVNGMGQRFLTDGSTYWFNTSHIGLNLNLPIFTGFQRKYKVQQSELTLQKLNNNIDLVKQGIDIEQVVSKEVLVTAINNLDLQERNQELARKVYNNTKSKFEQGFGSSFEVLLADVELQNAQSGYLNALYYATVAKISYLYSLGKLQ